MKLKELIKIESGVNTVRLKDNEYELYTLEDVNYQRNVTLFEQSAINTFKICT